MQDAGSHAGGLRCWRSELHRAHLDLKMCSEKCHIQHIRNFDDSMNKLDDRHTNQEKGSRTALTFNARQAKAHQS